MEDSILHATFHEASLLLAFSNVAQIYINEGHLQTLSFLRPNTVKLCFLTILTYFTQISLVFITDRSNIR